MNTHYVKVLVKDNYGTYVKNIRNQLVDNSFFTRHFASFHEISGLPAGLRGITPHNCRFHLDTFQWHYREM